MLSVLWYVPLVLLARIICNAFSSYASLFVFQASDCAANVYHSPLVLSTYPGRRGDHKGIVGSPIRAPWRTRARPAAAIPRNDGR